MGFFSDFGGDIIGAVGGLIGGDRANDASSNEASASRAYTTEQLQNKHQWEVSDLKKAGLNPILSANGSGSIGSSAMAQQSNIASNLSSDISNARNARSNEKDTSTKKGKLDLETQLSKSQIELLKSQSANQIASAKNQASQANLTNTTNLQKSRLSPIYQGVGEVTQSAKSAYDQLKGDDAWFKNLPKFGRGLKNTYTKKMTRNKGKN